MERIIEKVWQQRNEGMPRLGDGLHEWQWGDPWRHAAAARARWGEAEAEVLRQQQRRTRLWTAGRLPTVALGQPLTRVCTRGSCVRQRHNAWHVVATRLRCPDRWAPVVGAVSDKWARSYLISARILNAKNWLLLEKNSYGVRKIRRKFVEKEDVIWNNFCNCNFF
jgi:hypothetical protein